MTAPDPRELPRESFDPLICAVYCSRGKEIPYDEIEQQVSTALARSNGKLTPSVLKPIRKHFEQYMPLPAKSTDPIYRRLENAPTDPRTVQEDDELALVEHLYRTLKQDFTVSLLMRFANPTNFCIVSQPIRKAARWIGTRIDQKRADREYIELMRALRRLKAELGIKRVADLDRGLYSLYYRCLVGEGRRCTNFESLARSRHQNAITKLGDVARSAAGLRQLFQGAQEQLEDLDTGGQSEFLARLADAITEFGTEITAEFETRCRQFFQQRSREIGKAMRDLAAAYPALGHFSAEGRRLLAGASLMWQDAKERAAATPGLIAVSCGQSFEHELRDVVFNRIAPRQTNGLAYSWLAEQEPIIARHGEAEKAWRAALDCGPKGPKFETLIRIVSLSADPGLASSHLTASFRDSLLRSFPGLSGANTPESYGPARFSCDLDRVRELRNRCVHDAAIGSKLGPRAAELVFGESGILRALGN